MTLTFYSGKVIPLCVSINNNWSWGHQTWHKAWRVSYQPSRCLGGRKAKGQGHRSITSVCISNECNSRAILVFFWHRMEHKSGTGTKNWRYKRATIVYRHVFHWRFLARLPSALCRLLCVSVGGRAVDSWLVGHAYHVCASFFDSSRISAG